MLVLHMASMLLGVSEAKKDAIHEADNDEVYSAVVAEVPRIQRHARQLLCFPISTAWYT